MDLSQPVILPVFPAGPSLAELAQVCWRGTVIVRRNAHLSHGRLRCPTPVAPYTEGDPRGDRVKDVCRVDECLDIYHDVLVSTSDRLRRRWAIAPPADPVRYAASVVPTVVVNRERALRTAMGWPAKPTRADGKAAAVNAHLMTTAGDGLSGQWYVALFRILRAFATRLDRRDANWPLDGLAREKSKYLPVRLPAATAEAGVSEDIRHVLHTAEQAVGREWVHQMIWHPLIRGVVAMDVPDDLLAPNGELENQVLTTWFRDEYLNRRARGIAAADAFKAAARTVSGREMPDPDQAILCLLQELEISSARA